jgi:pimeloyl-ACP methyl ester carboxylesterase/DNA-binding CsgD family transcriptional regulator
VEERIRFCTAPDGVRIAYVTRGTGPALVRVATWLTHLEFDPQIYRHWFTDLADGHTYIRYDLRGCGLSDRNPRDLSLEAKVSDLEAAMDAAGVQRAALLGVSGGGPVAVAYAVRHPQRVSHLVLYGSYVQGRGRRARRSSVKREENRLLISLTRIGWGQANPAFRRVFSTMFMPDASSAELEVFDEVQRLSTSADTAARIRQASQEVDVSALARQVRVPTLVLHTREDAAAPFEEGRRLAGLIPGAQFVPLPGRNHILGADDPAWHDLVAAIRQFLAGGHPRDGGYARPHTLASLTIREHAVLLLVADGCDNDEVARRLQLSVRTVERHLSNVYAKLGVSGKSARAAAAAQFARQR